MATSLHFSGLRSGRQLGLIALLFALSAPAQAHDSKPQADPDSAAKQANIDHRQPAELAAEAAATDETRERIDFSLSTDRGEWQLSSLRGQVVFVVFGYTSCVDVCPTSLQILAEAFDQLEPEYRQRARGVFVSVDPQRDSNARLREYVSAFHPNIVGVTGTEKQVRALADELGVRFKVHRASVSDDRVDHATLAFAIDPQGYKLMVLVSHAAPPSFVAQLVRDTLLIEVRQSETRQSGALQIETRQSETLAEGSS